MAFLIENLQIVFLKFLLTQTRIEFYLESVDESLSDKMDKFGTVDNQSIDTTTNKTVIHLDNGTSGKTSFENAI